MKLVYGLILAVCAAIAIVPLTVHAAPYASGIVENAGSVSFFLNEAADNVSVFRDGVQTSLGALSSGSYKFARDGASKYYIQVLKAALSGYVRTSTNSTLTNFELPRGVAVNTNASLNGAPNPNFGRIYVSNGRNGSTGSGRPMVNGFYALNADLSEAFSARDGGVDWLTGTSTPGSGPDTAGSSPYRVQVGPDDRLYVADFSDLHSGVWALDADGNNGVQVVVGNTARNTAGLTDVHGSVSDVKIIGTGANRALYTTDEDFVGSNGKPRNILRYDIGTASATSSAPTIFFNNGNFPGGTTTAPDTGPIVNSLNSLDRAADGTWWMSQYRSGLAGEKAPSLIEISSDGTSILWSSLSLASAQDSATDPLRGTQGIAYDPVRNVLALVTNRNAAFAGTGQGVILILDANTNVGAGDA